MLYICKKCGNIIQSTYEVDDDILSRKYHCQCNSIISMQNSYPPLNSQDFVSSVNDLLNQAKLKDKENLNELFTFLNNEKVMIDKTKLDSYLNFYEKIREKYPDNNRDFFFEY